MEGHLRRAGVDVPEVHVKKKKPSLSLLWRLRKWGSQKKTCGARLVNPCFSRPGAARQRPLLIAAPSCTGRGPRAGSGGGFWILSVRPLSSKYEKQKHPKKEAAGCKKKPTPGALKGKEKKRKMHGVTVNGASSWTVEKHASLVVGRVEVSTPASESRAMRSAVEEPQLPAFAPNYSF